MNNLQEVSMTAAKAVMAAIENAGIDTASVILNPSYGVLYFSGSACGAIDLNVGYEDPDYYWLSTAKIDDISGVHLRNIQTAYIAYSAAIMAAVYAEELPKGWVEEMGWSLWAPIDSVNPPKQLRKFIHPLTNMVELDILSVKFNH